MIAPEHILLVEMLIDKPDIITQSLRPQTQSRIHTENGNVVWKAIGRKETLRASRTGQIKSSLK